MTEDSKIQIKENENIIDDIIEYLMCYNDFDSGDEPHDLYCARFEKYIDFMKSLKTKTLKTKSLKQPHNENVIPDDFRDKCIANIYARGFDDGYKKANETNDVLGTKNVCFSLANSLDKDDERIEIFRKQREERGFDDSELWNLGDNIMSFILPRLKEFSKNVHSYPPEFKSLSKWKEELKKMIDALEVRMQDYPNRDDMNSTNEGWNSFLEHIFWLWD